MHYALSNGQSKEHLNTDDLNGGLAVWLEMLKQEELCNFTINDSFNSRKLRIR